MLLTIIAVGVDPIDVGEDLSHCDIQLSRNFATHAGMFEKQAGEGLVFEDGNLMLLGDFADAQGVQARAFRHDPRRGHAAPVVAQSDREMRRVGDDHIGLRHFREHLLHAARPATTHAGLHLGIAFLVLRLVLDLFLGHLEILVRAPELVTVVNGRQHEQREAHAHHDLERRLGQERADARHID